MASNIQELTDEIHLEAPHFDQEATVLSARPVVPLEKVQNDSRRLGQLTIWMGIAAALLIGAFGATLIHKAGIYKFGGADPQAVDNAIEEEMKPVKLESGVIGSSDSVSEAPAVENVRSLPKKEVVKPRPTVIPKAPKIGNESQLEDQIERRRAERRAAREQRRADREARQRDPDRPQRIRKDLSRIEEIFEGVRRP